MCARAWMPHPGPPPALSRVLIAVLTAQIWLSAQGPSATISGVVTDSSGSVVPEAVLDVLELSSGRGWASTSDGAGFYRFPALPPGRYHITVSHPGFRSFASDALRVDSGQMLRFDVTLQLAAFADVVDVHAGPPALQTASVETGLTLMAEDIAALPAIGRNFVALTLLTPGAVIGNPASLATGIRTTGGGRPFFNGNRKEANNYQLDGIDSNQTTDNLLAYQPSLDAISEIRMTTGNASAEYGNYQGGLVNVTLKSGSNQAHGSLFGLVEHDALNATNWAAKWRPPDPVNPRRKPPLYHGMFGATAGGPIVRNRVFFFGDYQAMRRRTGRTTRMLTLVPAAMRTGDLSILLEGANPQQLFDPLTTRPDPDNPGQLLRDPFPGNRIPADRIDPVATAIFGSQYYPLPSFDDRLIDNAFTTTTHQAANDQFDIKVDARASEADDVSVRYAHGLQMTRATQALPILMAPATDSPFRAVAVQWVRHLGPRVLNEARVGMNRIVARQDGGLDAGGIGNLGEAVGIRGANRNAPGLPAISFGGAASTIGSTKIVQSFTTNTFQYQNHVTWYRGAHAVKAGGLAVRYQQNVYFSGNTGQLGIIEFNGQYTRDLADPRSTGSPIADFLLGYPRRMARGDYAGTWGHRSTLLAGFVQHDWRASANVTLNLGLRYEYRTPFVEVHDRQVNFDLHTGEALFAGRDGNSRGLYEPYRRDWQPRLGAAWTPGRWRDRLVLRGGYAISSFLEGTGTNLRLTLNPPFFNEFETINSPAQPGASLAGGFDALREKDPLTGTILRAWDPRHRPARSQQWNVTAEAAGPYRLTLSVGYVGQYGTHLVVPVNFNQRVSPDGPRPFDGEYPQISGVILTTPNADQRYDALQAVARRRFTQGWSVIGSYTLSRGMTHARGFFSDGGQGADQASFWPNPRDRDAEWGPVPFDARHNLTLAALWDVPFGTGRRWGDGVPWWLQATAGGWSLAGVWKARSGLPITILAPDQSGTGARSGRPDVVGRGRDLRQVGPDGYWFDPSVYVLPQPGTFGNAPVGSVRGPGLTVVDLALSRRIALAGTTRLELRAEAFNLFNTPVFEAPSRDLTSSTFGRVLSSQLQREIQLQARVAF